VGLLGLEFLLLAPANAATPTRFFIGGYAEAAHFLTYQGYGFGGELGVSVSDLLSLVAEGATGSSTLTYSSDSQYSSSLETIKLALAPLSVSIHFTAPLGDRVQPYVGAGIAYCNLKLTDTYTYRDKLYPSNSSSTSQTRELHALAPIFKLGLAVSLAEHVKIVGEYRQIVAKDKSTNNSAYGRSESEVYFGHAAFKLGIRIIF